MKSDTIQNGEKKDLKGNFDISVKSLHGELQEVINTMGPPTLLPPVNAEIDSGDEATISSNFSSNSNSSNAPSFVEIIIKNHHKKTKIIRDNVQHRGTNNRSSCCNIQVQTECAKDVIMQDTLLNIPEKDSKATNNNIEKNKTEDVEANKTTVSPQRYFQINFASNKKQPTVIDLMSGNSNYPKIPPGRDTMQNFVAIKRNEKKVYVPESESLLRPLNGDNYQGKAELYYFDRGNFSFYNTTDYPPVIMADHLAEKTELSAIRFWAETFGMANVILAFVTTFILQLIKFILFGIIRPMTAGVVQLLSDYFIKPLLAAVFNGLIQPPMIFAFNVLSSVRDVCEPIAQTLGFFMQQIAVVFKHFRIIEVKKNDKVSV